MIIIFKVTGDLGSLSTNGLAKINGFNFYENGIITGFIKAQ